MGGKTRIRRTAEEARERILDVAESQLRARGPDGLRLKELAREVGISHPAILHHFGSRTGLVRAVVARITHRVQQQIVSALDHDIQPASGATLLDRVFRVMAEPGLARMLAWLSLSPEVSLDNPMATHVRDIAEAMHRIRCQRKPEGEPAFEDTLFTVLLAAMAPIGNAIAGDALRASAGLAGDPDADRRFIVWLANLVHQHLDGSDERAR